MEKGKLKTITIIILCLLIAVTLAFIWGNSIPNQTDSATQSEGVYQTVKPVLDDAFGEDQITHRDFRKFAHVAEFFVLGLEVILLCFVIKGFSYKGLCVSLSIGLLVAIIDEVIQIFSKRGATFIDVVIDFLGVIIANACFILVYSIIKKKNNNND